MLNNTLKNRKVYNNGFGDYYYRCQKCESESVDQINDGSFSPPDLICSVCKERVINNPIHLESDQKNKAERDDQFILYKLDDFVRSFKKLPNKHKLKLLNRLVCDVSTTDIRLNSLLNQISNLT